jgi:hypothetical protein
MGTDEAGYGPNLGPLLISVTAWRVPGRASEVDLYDLLRDAVDRDSHLHGTRLHIADSKQVYTPAKGIGSLETSALALLAQLGPVPRSYSELVQRLTGVDLSRTEGEPWLREGDLALPMIAALDDIERLATQLREVCVRKGVVVESLASDMVETPRFNRECEAAGSKGVVLTRATLSLLERHWPADGQPTLVICDKHGGRNQYSAALSEAFDEMFITRLSESAERSAYKIRGGEVRFQVRAEQHLPTAAASILSKYLREVSMEMFNRYWVERVPGLKPTKGYPEDAKRFRESIADTARDLGISDLILWRQR